MPENTSSSTPSSGADVTLNHLRQQIDVIDNEIVSLLKKRMEVVAQVGHHKSHTQSDAMSFIRSGREATMLRDLTQKMSGSFPAAAVATIWRMIISTSLHHEKALTITVYATDQDTACYWLSREYWGNFIPYELCDNANDVIEKVASHSGQVGVLPLYETAHRQGAWWVRPSSEANELYVFARIPFIDLPDSLQSPSMAVSPVLAIANIRPEPTGDDISLCAVKGDKESLLGRITSCGVEATCLFSEADHHLCEIEGFIEPGSDLHHRLQEACGDEADYRLLGAYARPIAL